MNTQRLKGKVALITGGNSGIGLATALLFRDEGAKVVITGRDERSLMEAKEKLGPDALALKNDVSNLKDLDRLFETIKITFGGLDVVFANAGVADFVPMDQVDEAYYTRMMDINVKGLYFTVQKAAPLLREGASIILTGSSINVKGRPGGSVYGASKAAVRSLARSFSSELVSKGARVNVLSPGPIETPIFKKMGKDQEGYESMMEKFKKSVPLKRLGRPEEIAKVALFLASDDSSFLLGSEIYADGGVSQL